LKHDRVGDRFPKFVEHSDSVAENLHELGIDTYRLEPGSPIHFTARNLVPGERQELIFRVGRDIGSVEVNLKSVTPRLSADKQNQLFATTFLWRSIPRKLRRPPRTTIT